MESSPDSDKLWLRDSACGHDFSLQPCTSLCLFLIQLSRPSSKHYLHTVTSLCAKLLDIGPEIIINLTFAPYPPNQGCYHYLCPYCRIPQGWVDVFFSSLGSNLQYVNNSVWRPINLIPMELLHSTGHRKRKNINKKKTQTPTNSIKDTSYFKSALIFIYFLCLLCPLKHF